MIDIGLWDWIINNTEDRWDSPGSPDGPYSALDLRTDAQAGQVDGIPGKGIFIRESAEPTALVQMSLGDKLDRALSVTERSLIQNILGFTMTSLTPADVLWDMATKHTDPTGINGHRPLVGSRRRSVKLVLPGLGVIREEEFTDEHLQQTIAVFQVDYTRARSNGMSRATLRMWVGSTMFSLFGDMSDALALTIVPSQFHVELPLWAKPETTLDDNFNRTDNTTELGTSSDGDWSWSNVLNHLEIVSNNAEENDNQNSSVRADKDLSSVDHFSQCLIRVIHNASGFSTGPRVRYASSADTAYQGRLRNTSTTRQEYRIDKVITGTVTSIATGSGFDDITLPETIKIDVAGSDLELFEGGVSKLTVSNGDITGGLRGGLFLRGGSTVTNVDDFRAESAAVAGFVHSQTVLIG